MKKLYYQFFKYLLIMVIFLFLFDSSSQELKWEAIKNASGYKVQVRNESQKIILDKNVTTNSYELGKDVEPGMYEHRIGVLNKFGVAKTWTDWVSFEVTISAAPRLTNEDTVYIEKEVGTKNIVLEGENFVQDTKVQILSSKGSLPVKDVQFITKNKLEATLGVEDASIGEYDLVLENPHNKTYQKKRFIVVKERDKFTRCSLYEPLWRSAVVPGWGQYHRSNQCGTKEKWKLKVYPAIAIALLVAYYQTNKDYNQKLAEYNESINTTFLIPRSNPLQIVNFAESEQKYTQVEQATTRLNQVSNILLGFYLWNIADLFLFHPYEPVKVQTKGDSAYLNFYSNIYYVRSHNYKSGGMNLQYTFGFRLWY